MKSGNHLKDFISAWESSLQNGSFIKATLGGYDGAETGLKNIYIRKVSIRDEEKMNLTYRYQTKDIVKNFSLADGLPMIENLLMNEWQSATIFSAVADFAYQRKKNGKSFFSKSKPTQKQEDSAHNREKKRLVAPDKKYLHLLGLTDEQGRVHKNAQDKYRQIDKYIEILSGLIKDMPQPPRKILDMGSGKGYLTFALYDYLLHEMQQPPHVMGIEYRPDLVSFCNQVAAQCDFNRLGFTEGTIRDTDASDTDILIALHACDTATDDAIYKGIDAKASLIVVAPCCHKQIRREMETNGAAGDLQFLTRYGTFMERQAEMATDGLRALLLEYWGYDTKVFEFISDAHTPKNVLIIGMLNPKKKPKDPAILEKIKQAKTFYGIRTHHLETLLEAA